MKKIWPKNDFFKTRQGDTWCFKNNDENPNFEKMSLLSTDIVFFISHNYIRQRLVFSFSDFEKKMNKFGPVLSSPECPYGLFHLCVLRWVDSTHHPI